MKKSTLDRRSFLGTTAAFTAAGAVSALTGMHSVYAASKSKNLPVGLQLYTLRDIMQKDFTGTLKKVAEIGYDAVEFAGYGGMNAKDLKKLLDDLGLIVSGTHEGFENMEKNPDATIEFNAAIGCPNIVCPAMPGEWRNKGGDGFRTFGERLTAMGKKVKAAGMQFVYHNHNFEFEKDGDTFLIDRLLETADPGVVKLEVDVYWVKYAGVDPVQFISSHASRCGMIHMKDMADDSDRSFAPVGTGVIDLQGIVKAAKAAGVKWFVVEQDRTKQPPLEAVTISLKNMRKLLS